MENCNAFEVPIIRPPMFLEESGLNSEQATIMRPIYCENRILVLKQVVFMARVVFRVILFSRSLLYNELSIAKYLSQLPNFHSKS